MSDALRRIDRPATRDIPASAADFLAALGGPCAILVPGRDRGRVRAVTTLLHGNEPSGFAAVHRWLRDDAEPAVDTLLVIANVEAALAPPGFDHRMLPGREDLNRCFLGPFTSRDGALAQAILQVLREARPEAVLDIHNNSGHNPPYAVGVEPTREALSLAGLFGHRFVWSHLQLGALMEAIADLPSATIEVGRSGDPAADEVAYAGLSRFLASTQLFGAGPPEAMQVLVMPMRVRLQPGTRLAIADAAEPDADLTIQADLDRHNFECIPQDSAIGWAEGTRLPLELIDEAGRDRAAEFFRIEKGQLRTRIPLVPIMITTDPKAAAGDCLFYIVREHDEPAA
jgi:hypothetical protein